MKIEDARQGKRLFGSQPILEPGEPDGWDGLGVYTPHILKDEGVYRMYFSARDSRDQWFIGMATSRDLFHWTKHPQPVLTSGDDWDKQIDFAWPLKVNSTYYLFFEAKENLQPEPRDPVPAGWDVMTIRHM